MKTSVYCKTISKGTQAFYLSANGEDYLLFVQSFRWSNKEYFANGKPLSVALSTSGVHSTATMKTIEKLRPAIRYIEKEYEIAVLNRTLKKGDKKKASYNRQKFMLESKCLLAA